MANQTYRVLEIIKRFNNNEKVCISQLQNETMWYGKNEKTIRRDLDIIKEIFRDSFHRIGGEQGCYKAITNELMENIINPESISMLVQTFNIAQRSNLFDDLNINILDKKILQKKIKESKNIYLFKSKPFENSLVDMVLFKKLEQAIYYKKKIMIKYELRGNIESFKVKPYKILFMNENFYLASEVENQKYIFTPFRIRKIKDVEIQKEIFYHHKEIDSFIKQMQTPLAIYSENYDQKLIDVVVEVDSKKAEHFRSKKYLSSQKIKEVKENGSLVLSFKVTQNMEIEELVKRWLPHIKVITPESLKKKIDRELKEYLKL